MLKQLLDPTYAADPFLSHPWRRCMDANFQTSRRPGGQLLVPAAGLLPLTAAARAHLSRKGCWKTCCCLGIVSERTARLTNKVLSHKPWFARRFLRHLMLANCFARRLLMLAKPCAKCSRPSPSACSFPVLAETRHLAAAAVITANGELLASGFPLHCWHGVAPALAILSMNGQLQ